MEPWFGWLICRSQRAVALPERRVRLERRIRRVPQQQALLARLHLLQVPQVLQQVRGRKPPKHPQRHSWPPQAQLRQAQPI